MGVLQLLARLNLCSGASEATTAFNSHAMGNFAIKKGPPPRRGGMRGVVHLCGHRWMGDWEPVTDSLRGHDTLKAGDVLAEPLTGAQC